MKTVTLYPKKTGYLDPDVVEYYVPREKYPYYDIKESEFRINAGRVFSQVRCCASIDRQKIIEVLGRFNTYAGIRMTGAEFLIYLNDADLSENRRYHLSAIWMIHTLFEAGFQSRTAIDINVRDPKLGYPEIRVTHTLRGLSPEELHLHKSDYASSLFRLEYEEKEVEIPEEFRQDKGCHSRWDNSI